MLSELSARRFKFNKRGQLFIGVHNETLSVVTVRVNNPDRSPVGIDGWDPAQTPPSTSSRSELTLNRRASSKNAVSLSSARTVKRRPSRAYADEDVNKPRQ
jgi:hypothetical protein